VVSDDLTLWSAIKMRISGMFYNLESIHAIGDRFVIKYKEEQIVNMEVKIKGGE
jgi:hypothetical protein